jgi:hypothetical protein
MVTVQVMDPKSRKRWETEACVGFLWGYFEGSCCCKARVGKICVKSLGSRVWVSLVKVKSGAVHNKGLGMPNVILTLYAEHVHCCTLAIPP